MIIVWSAQARRDLFAIRDFIGRDSERYAQAQVERLILRIERTAQMPSRGHPVHEFVESGLREVHEGAYRIIYRVKNEELQIVTIVHMQQLLQRDRLT